MSKGTELLDCLRSFGKLILMVVIFRLGSCAEYFPKNSYHVRLCSIILSLPLHLTLYLNFPPLAFQCHDLNSKSLFKLPPLAFPQCHDLKSNSLFKLSPLAFHNAMI